MRCRTQELWNLGFTDGLTLFLDKNNTIVGAFDRLEGEAFDTEYKGLKILSFESDGLRRSEFMTCHLYAKIGRDFGYSIMYGAPTLSHLQFHNGIELYLSPGRTVNNLWTVGQVQEVTGNATETDKQSLENFHIIGFTSAPVAVVNADTDDAAGYCISSSPTWKSKNVILEDSGRIFAYHSPLSRSYLTTQSPVPQYPQPVSKACSYRRARFLDT